jgi:hypothetical protein
MLWLGTPRRVIKGVSSFAVEGVFDVDRHTRASLPDIIIAELRQTQNVPATTTVEKITFSTFSTGGQLAADGLVDEWLYRQLFTSYTDSFVS